jgi:hypothetical protein
LCLAFFLVVIFAAAGVTAFTRLPSAALTPLKHIVSTEAAHSFTVSSAVEKSASPHPPFVYHRSGLARSGFTPRPNASFQLASYRSNIFSAFFAQKSHVKPHNR